MTVLVLLPGMDGTGDLFDEFVVALGQLCPATDVRIVRYPRDRFLSYVEIEQLVRAQLPTRIPYAILGESFSGPIALCIASNPPSDLIGLVLCCSFARHPWAWLRPLAPLLRWLPVDRIAPVVGGFFLCGKFATPTILAALRRALASLAPGLLTARAAAVLGIDARPALARIGIPLLYLRASDDRLVPRRVAKVLAHKLPRMRLSDLTGPHFLLQTAPLESAREVCQFLAQIRATDPEHA